MRISDWSSDVCSSDLAPFFVSSCRACSGIRPHTPALGARWPPEQVRVTGNWSGSGCGGVHPIAFASPFDSCNAPFNRLLGSFHALRSEEHTSELQSLMRISYAVFCLKKKKTNIMIQQTKT